MPGWGESPFLSSIDSKKPTGVVGHEGGREAGMVSKTVVDDVCRTLPKRLLMFCLFERLSLAIAALRRLPMPVPVFVGLGMVIERVADGGEGEDGTDIRFLPPKRL